MTSLNKVVVYLPFKTCTTCHPSTESNPGTAQIMACQCIFLPVAQQV